jgi:hypothetical protein
MVSRVFQVKFPEMAMPVEILEAGRPNISEAFAA